MAIRINVVGDYNDKDIKRAQRDLDKLGGVVGGTSKTFSQKFADMGASMATFGANLTTKVTLPIVGLGVLAVNAASDLQEATSKATVVFGDAADSVLNFASTASESLGISEAAALEAAGTYGNLFRAMGIGEGKSAELSTSLVGLASDLASFNNANPQEVFDALRSGLSGETEPLKRFGINLNQARIEAEALNLGLIAQGEEMDAAAKAQAVYSLVMQDTELAQGDFARTSDGTANQMRILKARFTDIAAELGAVLLPIVERVSEKIGQLTKWFSGLDEGTKNTIVTFLGIAAALGPILLIAGKVMGVIVALKGVFAGIAAAVSAPVLIVVAIIAGLVAAFIIAWQRSEEFRDTVMNVFNDVKTAVMDAWEGFIKPALDQLVQAFQEHVMPAVDRIGAKFMEVWPSIREAIASAWGYIQPVLQFLVNLLTNVVIPVVVWLAERWIGLFGDMASRVSWFWTNIAQPVFAAVGGFITGTLVPVFNRLLSVGKTVWNGLSGAISFAAGIISGVFQRIKDGISSVRNWFSDRVESIKGVFSTIADAISGPFKAAFNFVADAWNNTVGKLSWTVPDWVPFIGGNTISAPKLPKFDKGGIVPGIPGDPQLAILHAGEMVLRRSQIDQYQRTGDSGGGDTFNITVNGMVGRDKREILDYLARELPKAAVKAGRSFG